jgi:hypothetical protein
LESTATQNEVEEQETESKAPDESIDLGADQIDPLKLSACPESPTATQNDAVVHETALSALEESIRAGADQVEPLKVSAWPE